MAKKAKEKHVLINKKRILCSSLVLFLLFTTIFTTNAQVLITGNIVDIESKTPISTVSVVLYKYGTNKIIGYTTTGDKGNFKLDVLLQKNIYSIKFRHLSYQTKEQSIIVNQESTKNIKLSISLTSKTQALEEVKIKAPLPIIVKKDTIIYNIKHWAKKNDQTLEDVIGKIDGFKILADGEIEVKGHHIRKVVVDGKEIFDVGASVFTKSIDPSKVKSIEVRFDEKNAKLKESLLDAEKYVVLDIKLKDDFKQSIFGKIRHTIGYQNKFNLGGYTNIFSLNKKTKIHFFAEIDDFGNQTISLKNIKHIGEEALQKLFELPADFKSLTEKENYQEELYGFNNYNKNEKRIVGFTSKFELNKKLNLLFGSYNSIDNIGKSRMYEQTITNNPTNSFAESNNLKEIASKSKLELKYDTEKTKIILNTNLVYSNSDFEQENRLTNQLYSFASTSKSLKNYNNLKFEHKINDKIGFKLKSSYSNIKNTPIKTLNHNNPFYLSELIDTNNNIVYDFSQKSITNMQHFISSFMFQFKGKIGIIETGSIYYDRKFSYQAKAINLATNNLLNDFTVPNNTYRVKNSKPFFKHKLNIGDISISNKFEYSNLDYQTVESSIINKQNLNYSLTFKYSNSDTNFSSSIKYKDRLSPFPLNKLMQGKNLIDFQTIGIPFTSITPQNEKIAEFTVYKDYNQSKINLEFAALIGKTNSLNLYSAATNTPFIYIQNRQLEGSYVIFSANISKKFKKGLSVILEPEFLTNKNQGVFSGSNYYSITDRYFLGLKIKNDKKNSLINYYLYPKYSKFIFTNTSTGFKNNQEMFSVTFNSNYEFVKSKLFFNLNARNVTFIGSERGDFTNLNISLNGQIKNINYKFTVENVFDEKLFIRQSINPISFTSENNVVFGRFLKLAVEYKFY